MYNNYIEHERMGKRWKLRRILTAQEKDLRSLVREYERISEEIRNLGYEQLQTPIPAGYKRLFVLTEETKHLKNSDFYQGILDKINTVRYSSTKQFNKKKTSKRWRRRKRKRNEQKLQEPEYTKQTLERFSAEELNFFYEIKYFCSDCKKEHIKYVFSEPWRFTLRIYQHFITEKKRIDTVLEQRKSELYDYLYQDTRNYGLLQKKLWCRHSNWDKIMKKYDIKKKYKDYSIINKPLYRLEDDYHNEKNYGNKT